MPALVRGLAQRHVGLAQSHVAIQVSLPLRALRDEAHSIREGLRAICPTCELPPALLDMEGNVFCGQPSALDVKYTTGQQLPTANQPPLPPSPPSHFWTLRSKLLQLEALRARSECLLGDELDVLESVRDLCLHATAPALPALACASLRAAARDARPHVDAKPHVDCSQLSVMSVFYDKDFLHAQLNVSYYLDVEVITSVVWSRDVILGTETVVKAIRTGTSLPATWVLPVNNASVQCQITQKNFKLVIKLSDHSYFVATTFPSVVLASCGAGAYQKVRIPRGLSYLATDDCIIPTMCESSDIIPVLGAAVSVPPQPLAISACQISILYCYLIFFV